jgi:hypothetical protein
VKDWQGSDPQCAFSSGTFYSENWNCVTANLLRDAAEMRKPLWSEDQYASLLPWEGRFILLSWYKHRGRTEGAWLVDGTRIEPLTLADTETYLTETAAAASA